MNSTTGTVAARRRAETRSREHSDRKKLRQAENNNPLTAAAIAGVLEADPVDADLIYEALFDDSADPILIFDRHGIHRAVNRAYLELLGMTRGQVIGTDVRDISAPSLYARLIEPALNLSLRGERSKYQQWLRYPDQSRRCMSIVFTPLRESNGCVSGSIVVVRDITQERRLEQEARLARQQFRDFAESAVDWLWETDALHRFSYVSQGFERATGIARKFMIGRPRESVFDRSRCLDGSIESHLRDCAAHKPFHGFEFPWIGQDGVRRWLCTSGKPVHDGAGEFQGYRGVARDITEQREALRALTESETRFRNLIEGSIQGIFIHRDLRPLFVNQAVADILGYESTGELLALPDLWPIFPPEERDRLKALNDARIRGEDVPECYQVEMIRKDGQRLTVQNYARHVRWMGQDAVQATVVDITQRTNAERALRASEERFRTLVEGSIQGIVIHRNLKPVFANKAYAEMLGYDGPEEVIRLGSLLPLISRHEHVRMKRGHEARMRGRAVSPDYEMELRRRDGSVFMAHKLATVITWEGEPAVQLSVVNIDRRNRAERALSDAHQRLSFHVDNSPLAVLEWDANCRLSRWSRQAERLFGWEAEEVIGKARHEWPFVVDADRVVLEAAVQELSDSITPRNVVKLRTLSEDGRNMTCEWHNSGLHDDAGNLLSIQSLVQDVTESHRLAERLSYEVSHDALTGLLNRRAFEGRLEELCASAAEHDLEHALCYIDLDQFKVVNDTSGHIAGDELLRKLGGVLSERVRSGDVLVRLGGDEFGLLLERCSLRDARMVAEGLRSDIERFRFVWDGQLFRIGASIGLVAIDRNSGSPIDLMRQADAACYQAKDAGRNRTWVFCADDAETMKRHGEMRWVSEINSALDEDRLTLYAQSIQPLNSSHDEARRFELLLRLMDRDGQIIAPNRFLPSVERYGLASRVDRWVVEAALRQVANGMRGKQRAYFCINLSGQTLSDETFHDFVHEQIAASGVDPASLCFEITETAAVSDLASAVGFMEKLQRIGCQFALDDFGSGLASFAYLKMLPVESLKIDGSLVRDIAQDETEKAIVRAIHDMSRALGKVTVAECVENEATLAVLREIGVDYAQGYHAGMPKPLCEIFASIP